VCPSTSVSPLTVFTELHFTYLYLTTTFIRRTSGRSLETFQQSCAGFDIEVALDITYFRRPRRRWKDNVKMGLKEIEDMDWIALTQVGTGGRHL
jgi:hypothetical protein